jgi:hypothetical protein
LAYIKGSVNMEVLLWSEYSLVWHIFWCDTQTTFHQILQNFSVKCLVQCLSLKNNLLVDRRPKTKSALFYCSAFGLEHVGYFLSWGWRCNPLLNLECFVFASIFSPEYGGSMFLQNSIYLQVHEALQPRRHTLYIFFPQRFTSIHFTHFIKWWLQYRTSKRECQTNYCSLLHLTTPVILSVYPFTLYISSHYLSCN